MGVFLLLLLPLSSGVHLLLPLLARVVVRTAVECVTTTMVVGWVGLRTVADVVVRVHVLWTCVAMVVVVLVQGSVVSVLVDVAAQYVLVKHGEVVVV